jgi:hypothetical protein
VLYGPFLALFTFYEIKFASIHVNFRNIELAPAPFPAKAQSTEAVRGHCPMPREEEDCMHVRCAQVEVAILQVEMEIEL